MREQHLDFLAITPRSLVSFGRSDSAGGIASRFIKAARDLPLWGFRTAFGFQWTAAAVVNAGEISQHVIVPDPPCRLQIAAGWADIAIAGRIVAEVFTAVGSILPFRLVDDGDVRRDILRIDKPVEVRGRTIGRI